MIHYVRDYPPGGRSIRALISACVAAITLSLSAASTSAQTVQANSRTPSFVRETWTARDGLPINSIPQILQSRTGYIWLATFDGLVRFDGVKFTVFNTANSEGIPSNRIVRIYETRDTTLWGVSEAGQLVKYRNGRFTTIRRADQSYLGLTSLHEDRKGNVWFATGHGVGIVRGDSIDLIAPRTISGPVFGIAESRSGAMWVIGAPGGLYRVSGNRADTVAGSAEMFSHNPTIISVDSSDGVWIGTTGGVYRFNGSLTRVPLAGTTGAPSYSLDNQGGIWAASEGQIFRLDRRGAERVFAAGPANHNGAIAADVQEHRVWYGAGPDVYLNGVRVDHGSSPLGLPNIVTMLVDREGSLWIGTTSSGLIRLKSSLFTTFGVPEGLGTDNAFVVASDRSGTVWTGLDDSKVAKISGDQATFAGKTNTLVGGVASILESRDGRMWIGADACDRLLKQCKSPPPGLVRAEVRAIYEEPDATMWFGTGDGLFRLKGDNWHRFTSAEGPPAATVRAFAGTPDGAIWMGTNGEGLSRFKDGRFTPVTTAQGLPGDLVRALYVDTQGFLWVGTEGMGLARLDPRDWGPGKSGSRIASIRQKDGLFDNGIHEILDDKLGSFWMSTNRGIFWVKVDDLNAFAAGRISRVRSTSYDERDGLRNREANGGSQPAGTRTPDGRLWFPTQAGIAVVDPHIVHSKSAPPNVVIERVIAGDSSIDMNRDIELGTSQRDIEIDYTALSFIAPEKMRFRYRLDPYDQDWNDADTRHSAFYTRVPPGHYTFQVTATNDAGVWTGPRATLSFDVKPKFYETRWFIALVALVLVALVWAAMRARVNRLQQRAQELQVRVDERTAELRQRESLLAAQNTRLETQADQLKELDRAKSRFFANVSHEFRTPLTLTIGPLEDARAHLASSDQTDAVSRIDMALRNARRLFGLVTQVLDVAKLEAGQMKIHARPADLVVFARGVASSFTALAERMNITFELRVPDSEVIASFDPDAMEKVIANLLSNAFKFTPGGGRIALSVESKDEDAAVIRVEDSGPGIPESEIEHVFERFYQVDESNTRAQTGTGIGLSLAQELADLHGGTIAVASAPSGGAVFTVTLPLLAPVAVPSVTEEELHAGNGSSHTDESIKPVSSAGGEDVTTLLVVDDSADMRAYIRARFEPRYRVIEGADGQEGLARAKESLPDLVISDVVMPGMDGHELFDALRSNPETDFIPVILLTAQAEGEQRIAGLDRGADDYIVKPFDMRELEARVDNLIASRRRLRERFSGKHVRLTSTSTDGRSPADREFLDKLSAALEAGLTDPDFGVAELANAVFQDRTNLFRRTRALLNETPSDLLRRVRLERASKLLTEGDDGIADIAYGVGFNSVSAFCRAFREAYQMTPSGYRESKTALR